MNDHELGLARERDHDMKTIRQMITDYFDGLHYADIEKLNRIFHDDVILKAPGIRRDKTTWIKDVAERPVPDQKGDSYGYQIRSLEVIGEQAMAIVDCPLLGHDYVDHLGFLKENDRWTIVNKMYAERLKAGDG
ncbi:MAG: nuclear transport factor 2 family protein [Oceanospirillaceae bacterium]